MNNKNKTKQNKTKYVPTMVSAPGGGLIPVKAQPINQHDSNPRGNGSGAGGQQLQPLRRFKPKFPSPVKVHDSLEEVPAGMADKLSVDIASDSEYDRGAFRYSDPSAEKPMVLKIPSPITVPKEDVMSPRGLRGVAADAKEDVAVPKRAQGRNVLQKLNSRYIKRNYTSKVSNKYYLFWCVNLSIIIIQLIQTSR